MRHQDWQLRLERFAAERAAMPFCWGANDCATFAAAGVEALTGVHLMPNLRGLDTARAALRVLRKLGGLDGIATAALGPSMNPRAAGIGDVVLVRIGKRTALGICNGSMVMGPGRDGIAVAAMDGALAAWRVD